MAFARALVTGLELYLGLGLAFALPFVHLWIGRVDPVARSGSRGFRWIVLPGCVLLWPLLALRAWRGGARAP